jgi:iron complex outermembrane receptor protein
MSITALGGGSLDKLQDRSFSDYAAMVPGLSLVSGDSGLTRLTLRGQNAGGDGSTVAVYLDESPFGSSNALLNGSVLSGDFDTWICSASRCCADLRAPCTAPIARAGY